MAGLPMLLSIGCASAVAQSAASEALRTRFAAVREQGTGALFDRPVYLRSTEDSGKSHGEVYALVDHPYAGLQRALTKAGHWCGILILHLNVQYCRPDGANDSSTLEVGIGRKFDQPLSSLHWLRLGYRVQAATEDRLDIVLQAPSGPFGTKDFRIELEAVPYIGDRSLVHLSYGYGYGVVARWAMQAYLSTLGRQKVGFSIVGRDDAGQPARAAGVRGMLERNTVRYYLAIEAYLDAQDQPPAQQLRSSLLGWFDATERYPLQLHELERDAYLAMKLREVGRQAEPPPPHP